jgi:hypothetical protein
LAPVAFREQDDAENLLDVLDLCIRNNFAGIESFRLYSETFWGTKVSPPRRFVAVYAR